MAKARPIPGVGEDDPFAAVAAEVVAMRAAELAAETRDVLDTSDIERVHDMRVATRRLRAALEVFEPCFPRKRFKATLREVKALADALGERRDRDVTIAALGDYGEAIALADRPGVRSLVDRLRAEQVEANVALAPFVTEERIAGLGERLAELVAEARALAAAPEDAGEPQPTADGGPAPASSGATDAGSGRASAGARANGGEPG